MPCSYVMRSMANVDCHINVICSYVNIVTLLYSAIKNICKSHDFDLKRNVTFLYCIHNRRYIEEIQKFFLILLMRSKSQN